MERKGQGLPLNTIIIAILVVVVLVVVILIFVGSMSGVTKTLKGNTPQSDTCIQKGGSCVPTSLCQENLGYEKVPNTDNTCASGQVCCRPKAS